LPSLLS